MTPVLDTTLLQQGKQLDENSVELDRLLKQLSRSADDNAIDRVISLYKAEIVKLEKEIWQQAPSQQDIENYQSTFIVLEKLYQLKSADTRHSFKIVIPVADRPQHLKHCLDSLYTLCQTYRYGGQKDQQYHKISVLIADDSRQPENIELHKDYCRELSDKGIATDYFGLEEQLELVRTTSDRHPDLYNIISGSDEIDDAADFSHKGASIMRNITYLKIKQLLSGDSTSSNPLIYFIDSDQEFCINTLNVENNLYAINYFHYLDEIFSTSDTSVLTGKVVGDPPVSPSVMAGNFQQDVYNFLHVIDKVEPGEPCQFHQHEADSSDDAAYHDMANLFGFSQHEQAFDYHCTLHGTHVNADCFSDFADKLGHFFYGEHPTRKTFFNYGDGFSAIKAARTVYTGNYVMRPECLNYFIPFATLKLRMAGPVLGRILKGRLQHRFVSANLPMLHNRTVEDTGRSEFRAGVINSNQSIDLGNEFIRQFYGDVMLFSIKKLTEQNQFDEAVDADQVQVVLDSTYNEIRDSYIEKHHTVLQLRAKIESQLKDSEHWWHNSSMKTNEAGHAVTCFEVFLNNIQSNFDEGSYAFQQITAADSAQQYLRQIHHAILQYDNDMKNWAQALQT
ncbi:MAG: glycosyltransferase family 2 protein [Gammaproteobacteria bacterium]|nr:glycosyltransferase family 2 protein [Gammaproteobacteria bacterium]NNJ51361.1 glycosyltransferase family 2 protein [Gammaproteobacteria bacterium]